MSENKTPPKYTLGNKNVLIRVFRGKSKLF